MSLAITLMLSTALAVAARAEPPTAPTGNVVDWVHGRPIFDPYRWMERLNDPALVAWAHAQNDFTRSVLASVTPGSMHESADAPAPEVAIEAGRLRRLPGGTAVFLARMGRDPVDALYTKAPDGTVAQAFAPAPAAKGDVQTISFFVPAPDGRHVAIAMAKSGSENSALYVLDLKTRRLVDGPITGVRFSAISWWPDSHRFAYARLKDTDGRSTGRSLYTGQQVYAHTVGTHWHTDRLLFGSAMPATADIPLADFPEVEIHAQAGLALGRHASGVAQEFGLFVAPLDSLDQARIPWRRVVGPDAGYGALRATGSAPIVVFRGRLYLTHFAGKGALHSIDLAHSQKPLVHYADPDWVVLGLVPAADGLYVQVQAGMRQRLLRYTIDEEAPRTITLPFAGQFDLVTGDQRLQGVLLRERSWTSRSRYWSVQDSLVSEFPIATVPVDGIALSAEEIDIPSSDGARIPLSIVYPSAQARAKPLPFVLTGYAAYGINMRPVLNENLMRLYRDGIGYAVCHARGGGELGDTWHRAAMKMTKHLSWEDFIGCAEWLIGHGYTRADRLLAEGASAGGILVGRAMTERPDLFAGVHLASGALNPMRAETHQNGAPNVAEFGSVDDPDQARWIFDMDTYLHVQQGVAYPAVLLTHGWNDARTPFWMSAKTAARLRASSTSGKPVLMNIDFSGGHQITSGEQSKVLQTKATIDAFFRFVLLGDGTE